MNNVLLFVLSCCQLLLHRFVFAQDCDCYPGTRCPSGTTGGLDPRIVNSGTTCSTGYVACCTTGSSNSGCGVSKVPPGAHPVGQAAYGAYPWMVAILDENSNYIGAGALITARHVLTASHKVAPYDPDEIIAALGMWSFQQNPYDPTILPISKIAIHPYYDLTNFHYDVAVLKLGAAAPITSAPNVNTVCLPSAVVGAGRKCWVTGWGKNTFNGNEQSTLKEVDVSVVSHANCQNALRQTRLGANFILDDSFMCAGGIGGKDACTGDGGSPLVCQSSNGQYSVFGIVSWGIGCANQGVPGVYADVISSLGWIQQNLT